MKRIKEKLRIIWHIIIGKQYAVFIISGNEKEPDACCIISDSATSVFLDSIVEFINKEGTYILNDKR